MNAKQLAEMIDIVFQKQQERLELQRSVDKLKVEEEAIKRTIIEALKEAGTEHAGGRLARFSFRTEKQPIVEDWDKLYAQIRQTGEFDLLHRRLTVGAVQLRWDADVPVAGVGSMLVDKATLTPLKSK